MTAKQKAARKKFKAVVKEAAKLRKKNPKLTQAQAVKQAFAISYSKKGKKLGSASRQTGTSDKKRDQQRKAKKPGKRKSGPGAQRPYYYEYRKNRTDKPGKLTGTHKDTKSHNVNIRVVSGVGNMPKYKDQVAAREISLYADNDSQLYYQKRKPILLNLSKKYKKGTYDIDKAAKLWRYYIDAAMQKYNKEFGSRGDKWYDLLSTSDRNLLATEYAIRTKQEFDLGNIPE
jgi:hypothetical protein